MNIVSHNNPPLCTAKCQVLNHNKRPRTRKSKVPFKMSDSWAREIVETFQETGSRDKKS